MLRLSDRDQQITRRTGKRIIVIRKSRITKGRAPAIAEVTFIGAHGPGAVMSVDWALMMPIENHSQALSTIAELRIHFHVRY